jgi:hypothetical protein
MSSKVSIYNSISTIICKLIESDLVLETPSNQEPKLQNQDVLMEDVELDGNQQSFLNVQENELNDSLNWDF